MARAPSAAGMLDIRTTAILQDIVFVTAEKCIPGVGLVKGKHVQNLYGARMSESVEENEGGPWKPLVFDSAKDWVAVLSSFAIVGTILGLHQSWIVFVPQIMFGYKTDAGLGQEADIDLDKSLIVGAAAYGMLIFCTPLASCLIGLMGVRLTCTLGLFLVFTGLMMDALRLHVAVLYISRIVLMGIGGSFAYTAATSSIVDRFRDRLPVALLVLSLASPVGTILYYSYLHYLFHGGVSYKWALISLAILVLILTFASHIYPLKVSKHLADPFHRKPRKDDMKRCVREASRIQRPCLPDPSGEPIPTDKSCICVCVCEVAMLCDVSFLLWASITVFIICSFLVPYLFLFSYDPYFRIAPDPPISLIFWFCVGSGLGRAATIMGTNFTHSSNLVTVQVCCIASGGFYIAEIYAGTYGWMLLWAVLVGILEGVFTTVIPRLALQTLPRRVVHAAWGYMVLLHGIALLAGVALITNTSTFSKVKRGRDFDFGFMSIGVAQIICGLLAYLLPNEEVENEKFVTRHLFPDGGDSAKYSIKTFADSFPRGPPLCGGNRNLTMRDGYSSCRESTRTFASSPGVGSTFLGVNGCGGMAQSYREDCPICSKIGCVPGCCPCTPGGLTSSLPMVPCAGYDLIASKISGGATKSLHASSKIDNVRMDELAPYRETFEPQRPERHHATRSGQNQHSTQTPTPTPPVSNTNVHSTKSKRGGGKKKHSPYETSSRLTTHSDLPGSTDSDSTANRVPRREWKFPSP